jgi:uncharacterized membrane protein YfcA
VFSEIKMNYLLYVLVGFAGGAFSGAFGIGGGTIMVPALVLLFGLSQHAAQGTSLAVMVLPVFILAAWRYYQEGHVHVPMAIGVAVGFVLGALLGAHLIQTIPDENLKKAFGVLLIMMGLRMVLGN